MGAGNTPGPGIAGMRYAVSSTVCGSLGVRAWQDMAATTAAFRHHLTSLNLPNTPGIPFPSDPRPSCQQEVTYTCLGLIYVSRWCDFKGTATHMQFPPSRQLAIFPESPPVPLQKASSTTWLEYSFQLTPQPSLLDAYSIWNTHTSLYPGHLYLPFHGSLQALVVDRGYP